MVATKFVLLAQKSSSTSKISLISLEDWFSSKEKAHVSLTRTLKYAFLFFNDTRSWTPQPTFPHSNL